MDESSFEKSVTPMEVDQQDDSQRIDLQTFVDYIALNVSSLFDESNQSLIHEALKFEMVETFAYDVQIQTLVVLQSINNKIVRYEASCEIPQMTQDAFGIIFAKKRSGSIMSSSLVRQLSVTLIDGSDPFDFVSAQIGKILTPLFNSIAIGSSSTQRQTIEKHLNDAELEIGKLKQNVRLKKPNISLDPETTTKKRSISGVSESLDLPETTTKKRSVVISGVSKNIVDPKLVIKVVDWKQTTTIEQYAKFKANPQASAKNPQHKKVSMFVRARVD